MTMQLGPGFSYREAQIAATFGSEDGRAIEIPLGDPRFDEIIIFGNGKDADLEIRLADGTELEMGLCSLTIACDSALSSSLRRYDDYNVVVRYAGTGLRVSSLRIAYSVDPRHAGDGVNFAEDVQEWVSGGFAHELNYVVYVHITLAGADD